MDKSTNRILIQDISELEILEISDQELQQVCGGFLGTLLGLTPPPPVVIIDGEVQQPEPPEPPETPQGLLGILSILGLGLI